MRKKIHPRGQFTSVMSDSDSITNACVRHNINEKLIPGIRVSYVGKVSNKRDISMTGNTAGGVEVLFLQRLAVVRVP
jgi:hypothetical protein